MPNLPSATVVLDHPNHGTYRVDAAALSNAVAFTSGWRLHRLRALVTGMVGLTGKALDDCTRIELLIIWVESGNHTFTI